MNILFCGDKNIADGLMIATASLLHKVSEPLSVTILTMTIETSKRQFEPLPQSLADYLDEYVKQADERSSVTLLDITDLFLSETPEPNMLTRFTPYCMLRLFADQIEGIPNRLLYLDTDVVCRMDPAEFYHQDLDGCEVAGVLDFYGRFFFRRRPFHMDYLNSGVLLLDMEQIRQSRLFAACRLRCRTMKMFMPDQSALNKLAEKKKICPRRYNEQQKMREDTVFLHFTTRFVFFPWFHAQTVKPWQIDAVHQTMKIFAFDDLLQEYQGMKEEAERRAAL